MLRRTLTLPLSLSGMTPSAKQSQSPRPIRFIRRHPLPIFLIALLALLLFRQPNIPPPPRPPPPPSYASTRVPLKPSVPPALRIVISGRSSQQAYQTFQSLKPHAWKTSQVDIHLYGNPNITHPLPNLTVFNHSSRPFEHVFTALEHTHVLPTVFVEAGTILAPSALTWLKQATDTYKSHPNVAGFVLDGARPRSMVDGTGQDYMPYAWRTTHVSTRSSVFFYRLCVAGSVFMPNHAPNHSVWPTFVEWLKLRRVTWYKYPTGVGVDGTPLGMGDLPERNWTRGAWNVWFSKFINEYQLSLVYPNLPSGAVMARNLATDRSRDMRISTTDLVNIYQGQEYEIFQMGASPPHFASDGMEMEEEKKSTKDAQQIAELARAQGGMISFTMVNKVFLETARSWLCNVDVAGFRPKGLLWAVTDAETQAVTSKIPNTHTVFLNAIEGGKETGHEFGNPGYWKLMLERTALIGEILKSGTAVFAFETDAIWLEDPAPYIEDLVEQGADIVGTINTRMEVSGNFFYLRPTLATRRLWNEISSGFEKAYIAGNLDRKKADSWTYIENDQSLLTKLVLRNETWQMSYPLSFLTLDMERFTDGRWYKPEEGFYTSKRARKPVMINNNFVIGVEEKTKRAKKWGHWFWDGESGRCVEEVVRKAIADPLGRKGWGSIEERDGAQTARNA